MGYLSDLQHEMPGMTTSQKAWNTPAKNIVFGMANLTAESSMATSSIRYYYRNPVVRNIPESFQ